MILLCSSCKYARASRTDTVSQIDEDNDIQNSHWRTISRLPVFYITFRFQSLGPSFLDCIFAKFIQYPFRLGPTFTVFNSLCSIHCVHFQSTLTLQQLYYLFPKRKTVCINNEKGSLLPIYSFYKYVSALKDFCVVHYLNFTHESPQCPFQLH